jgi:hypothetical protein
MWLLITTTLRLFSVRVSSKFYLYLISCHINVFNDVIMFLIREKRNKFYEDETLLLFYQPKMTHRIKIFI